ncbi:MAG: TIGR00730 family Rossman fold protein [Planctomycetes bacterium]|nr:TIGR00730 family Rossman fold protein [Planctomycetota bacterium]
MPLTRPRITVYCGSRFGGRPTYKHLAEAFGKALAASGLELVYGGGAVGLMGAVADAVLEAGGRVTGVIPRHLARDEIAHGGLSELFVVETMQERKTLMATLAGGFVALPGGIGTLEEIIEMLSWSQLGLHDKPLVLLDVDGYWDPLLALFEHSIGEGFIAPQHAALIERATSVGEAIGMLTA